MSSAAGNKKPVVISTQARPAKDTNVKTGLNKTYGWPRSERSEGYVADTTGAGRCRNRQGPGRRPENKYKKKYGSAVTREQIFGVNR